MEKAQLATAVITAVGSAIAGLAALPEDTQTTTILIAGIGVVTVVAIGGVVKCATVATGAGTVAVCGLVGVALAGVIAMGVLVWRCTGKNKKHAC